MITMAQGNEGRARMAFLTWSSEHPSLWAEPSPVLVHLEIPLDENTVYRAESCAGGLNAS